MPTGTVIAQERTAVPVEWDDMRIQLQRLTRLLHPTEPGGVSTLGAFINTAAHNLRGQGAARSRRQFDRAIGSFQAVKHTCAEMLIEIDATRALVMSAAMSATDRDELQITGPLAKAQAADTFVQCAGSAIQVHGGIAFTWEHDLHLYFRRAQTTAALFGGSAEHRALLADRAGL
jgi:hypothetical protein